MGGGGHDSVRRPALSCQRHRSATSNSTSPHCGHQPAAHPDQPPAPHCLTCPFCPPRPPRLPACPPPARSFLTDTYSGVLEVTVKRAANLRPADPNGSSDPYAVVSVANCSFRTRTVGRSLEPEWEETHCVYIRWGAGGGAGAGEGRGHVGGRCARRGSGRFGGRKRQWSWNRGHGFRCGRAVVVEPGPGQLPGPLSTNSAARGPAGHLARPQRHATPYGPVRAPFRLPHPPLPFPSSPVSTTNAASAPLLNMGSYSGSACHPARPQVLAVTSSTSRPPPPQGPLLRRAARAAVRRGPGQERRRPGAGHDGAGGPAGHGRGQPHVHAAAQGWVCGPGGGLRGPPVLYHWPLLPRQRLIAAAPHTHAVLTRHGLVPTAPVTPFAAPPPVPLHLQAPARVRAPRWSWLCGCCHSPTPTPPRWRRW